MDAEMKMKVIQEIMDDLQDQMEMGKDDFDERLGRKNPDLEMQEEVIGKDLDGDNEEGEPAMHAAKVMGDMHEDDGMMMEDDSPEDKLKARIMKMRG